MDASTSALVVAVTGVLGTLASGLLAHRSALRAKRVEFEHLGLERREERRAQERRELLEARRVAYASFNQSLRQFHAALFRWRRCLAAGDPDGQQAADVEEKRGALRDVYAEVQMVASDDVLVVGGGVVHLLGQVQNLIASQPPGEPAPERLEEAAGLLERASEGLYEARQTMRADLGVTDLPVQRPDGYGRPWPGS